MALMKLHILLLTAPLQRHVEVVGQSSYETPIQNMYAAADIKIVHVDFKKVL
jgi:hypothetical protein